MRRRSFFQLNGQMRCAMLSFGKSVGNPRSYRRAGGPFLALDDSVTCNSRSQRSKRHMDNLNVQPDRRRIAGPAKPLMVSCQPSLKTRTAKDMNTYNKLFPPMSADSFLDGPNNEHRIAPALD